MSGELQTSWSPAAPPPALVPVREHPVIERSSFATGVAGSGGEPAGFDPNLSTPAACARLARTRDPLVTAEAFALALADPLIAAERGTFDGMARDLCAAFAEVRPADAERFAARLAAAVRGYGEPAIEWAPPPLPPVPANGSNILRALDEPQVVAPRDGTEAGARPTLTVVPTNGVSATPAMKEGTSVSDDSARGNVRYVESQACTMPDWRAQLAAVAAQLPAGAAGRTGDADRIHRRVTEVAVATAPSAPNPEAELPPVLDLATLSARRARIVEADREQRTRAESALAERQTFLDRIARYQDELAAIRRERDLVRQDLADAFTDEARAGLTSIATEIERLNKSWVAALATDEWYLAALERRPEVAALLARQNREEAKVPETEEAAGATRRLPKDATATVPPVAAGQSDAAQTQRLRSANESPNSPAHTTLQETVGQAAAGVKRPTALDTVERARRRLRAGDANGAIAILGGLDARGLDREIERQAVGVLFAAAEVAARTSGMDDFRFLRLDRGTRVLLACEPTTGYGTGNAVAGPTYRVVAAYGSADERFVPGQAVPPQLLERAQPRRARS